MKVARAAIIRGAMQDFGKVIFILGLVLVAVGAFIWRTGGLGGLGRFPGDVFVQKGNSSFYFPIVTFGFFGNERRGGKLARILYGTTGADSARPCSRSLMFVRIVGSKSAAV